MQCQAKTCRLLRFSRLSPFRSIGQQHHLCLVNTERLAFVMRLQNKCSTWNILFLTDGLREGRPSLRSGREIGFAVAVRFRARAIFYGLSLCVCQRFAHALNLDIARAVWSEDCLLLFGLWSRRFCALTERRCLSSSPQAFRERLDPKLFSLAFYPQYSYLIALPTIMNYEL